MDEIKKIALVAHDGRKRDLVEWIEYNYETLIKHHLISTGTTGRMVEEALTRKLGAEAESVSIRKLKSGPLGGDQQLGALIAEGEVDLLIFLWDPMQPQPHDMDVKALLRIAVLYNIPTACNRASADFLVSSSLMSRKYTPELKDYSRYIMRGVTLT
jgi:methylglyoxal synthase